MKIIDKIKVWWWQHVTLPRYQRWFRKNYTITIAEFRDGQFHVKANGIQVRDNEDHQQDTPAE